VAVAHEQASQKASDERQKAIDEPRWNEHQQTSDERLKAIDEHQKAQHFLVHQKAENAFYEQQAMAAKHHAKSRHQKAGDPPRRESRSGEGEAAPREEPRVRSETRAEIRLRASALPSRSTLASTLAASASIFFKRAPCSLVSLSSSRRCFSASEGTLLLLLPLLLLIFSASSCSFLSFFFWNHPDGSAM
jgi:hypothetical protein